MSRRTAAARTLGSGSRVDLLHLLQSGGPQTVGDLADRTGLHENTAREHLQRLVLDGFVHREPEVRTTRGRPRIVYRAITSQDVRTDPVAARRLEDAIAGAALSRVLLAGYGRTVESVPESARAAGRDLAARAVAAVQTPSPRPAPDLPPEQRQLDALTAHLDRLGFDPDLEDEPLRFHLWRCPFLDLARERPDIVCSVHLGLAQGVLDAVGGPVEAAALHPFVEPHHCVLELRAQVPAVAAATTP